MERNHIATTAMLLLLMAVFPYAHSASFDCRKASTEIEHKICDNPSLSKLDEDLSVVFRPLKSSYFIQMAQREWLESDRDACESLECLDNTYSQQIVFLSPPSESFKINEAITALPADKKYFISDQLWKNWTLTQLPHSEKYRQQYIVATANLSGKLHVVVFDGEHDSEMRCYKGSLYEFVDQYPIVQPILYPIARDICFDGTEAPDSNDEGRRLAGVLSGVFYYRSQVARNQFISMAYKLGSRMPPTESSTIFQGASNTTENEKGSLFFSRGSSYDKLKIYYSHIDKAEFIASPNDPKHDWNIFVPVWSKPRPILYFKNGESIWRANIVDKTLFKISQAEDDGRIKSPMPIEINGREAILYLENDHLKVAIPPAS
ncbi:hypothetical protein OH710_17340 [Pseudomonas capsici]|uniref:lysozyme inhibitor LprI family protein n=1 Tax=Pseudomonas capsici TaxID=2810614 RepID=UPI0021F0F995|nr:hypothetical protein [Pseudomonas capsici]MCV4274406.1 hypothetical protein [Pseudomonas capsici]